MGRPILSGPSLAEGPAKIACTKRPGRRWPASPSRAAIESYAIGVTSLQLTTCPGPLPARTADARHRLNTLIQISRAIGTLHDSQELMQAIMQHVTAAFGAQRSTLYLHDAAAGELWTR